MKPACAFRFLSVVLSIALMPVCAATAVGQSGSADVSPPPASDKPNFTQEELDQMLAPIALYPDSLLTQILMASTYPIEVVEADRWAKAHTDLKGDALAKELEKQTWDPSVRSLVNFPQVLAMMSENLSTTVKIGDAFIGQQKEVMATVQKLRAKAQETGNLKSSSEQKVSTESGDGGTQVIVIESSSPDVIYVPQYNPVVVYGTWPYPAYPPYPYYPPGYVASNVVSFGLGVACGVAWGYAWGHCDWHHNDVNININQNYNFNQNINRNNFQANFNGNRGTWQHDPAHRQGAAYRNTTSAERVGASQEMNRATQARNDYRGKAETGRTDLNRGGADSFKANQANPRSSGSKGTAFDGARSGGASTRQASERGYSSRSSSPSRSVSRPQSSPSRSVSRPSGGGGRRR